MERRTRLLTGLLAVVIVVAAWLASPDLVLARLAWLAADPARFVATLLVLALVRPLLAWPTTLLAVAAGYGLGVASLPLALALIVATSVPPYLFARRGREAERLAGLTDASEQFVDVTGDLRSVTASRLLPAPSDVVSVAAGIAGVPLLPFVLGTAIGEIPWAVAGVLAGASMDAVATGGLQNVFDIRLVAAAGVVGAMLLARPVYRYVQDERTADS